MSTRVHDESPTTPPARRTQKRARRTEADKIEEALIENLHHYQAKLPRHATRRDWYMALAYTVRNRMLDRYIETVDAISGTNASTKVVAYLSAEYLTGPHLGNGLLSLGIWQPALEAIARVGQSLPDLMAEEEEPGLG